MGSATKSLYEAKTHLSELVDRASRGEEIVIAKNGIPMAKLVPLAKTTAKRKPGGWTGKVWIADDFDAPLPEDMSLLFEEAPIEPPARHARRPVVARRR
ncbi:MAG TPA: type II toxin-antitoxin system Phd/YefM family antitoxin [Polyangiaceae bacterium]|jgi:prevent-host-death family protein|nr:type II toxin-antitoxin system Phd/YefM family antitoxin [Polyangiaceae bacterium]